ncbi:ImmA/IrrE family metallo-endopeptidase [Microbacterium lacus]|uniref:ImmA/IrrE family metallo-endopeptidase n=1 Tax=Microbacterium lacus TaxID=415217 RepID=UPI000C2BD46A|nr:ImmA/IrrE family metallo-endopeptidase [Microbacterium lacus]
MAIFTTPDELRRSLRQTGLSNDAISAAWPQWWSEDAIGSPSAEAELRFSLARKLGLSAVSLMHDEPTFVTRGRASFKRASLTRQIDELMLTTVAQSLATLISDATTTRYQGLPAASEAREAILRYASFVSPGDLISLSWAMGVPVVSQAVFPLEAKRMDAMTVFAQGRPVILLARRTSFPAFLAFMIAHELGHIALGHVGDGEAVADLSLDLGKEVDYRPAAETHDPDETAADAFALELLTGDPTFTVETEKHNFNAAEAADAIQGVAPELGVDPGFVGLALARSSGRWPQVYGALRQAGHYDKHLMEQVNTIAFRQLDESRVSDDSWDYITRALGVLEHDG